MTARASAATRRTSTRVISVVSHARLTPASARLFGPPHAEGRHHLGGEGVERVPVVRAFAEGDVHPRAAGVAEAVEHLEVLLGRAAQPAGALVAPRPPVLAEDLLAALGPLGVGAQVEAQVHRAQDGFRVAPFLAA